MEAQHTRIVLITVLTGCLFASAQANSASVSYYLDQSTNGVNYAQVTIADSVDFVGDIEVTVEVITSAFSTPLSNFGMQAFYFNYDNDLTVNVGNIIVLDPSDWTISTDVNAGGGFDKFDFQIAGIGSNRTELLNFRITGVIGDTIESYAQGAEFLNPASTQYFAAHIAGYGDGLSGNTSGKFAGSSVVPIPAAVWLFGSGLGLLLSWTRRSRSALAKI